MSVSPEEIPLKKPIPVWRGEPYTLETQVIGTDLLSILEPTFLNQPESLQPPTMSIQEEPESFLSANANPEESTTTLQSTAHRHSSHGTAKIKPQHAEEVRSEKSLKKKQPEWLTSTQTQSLTDVSWMVPTFREDNQKQQGEQGEQRELGEQQQRGRDKTVEQTLAEIKYVLLCNQLSSNLNQMSRNLMPPEESGQLMQTTMAADQPWLPIMEPVSLPETTEATKNLLFSLDNTNTTKIPKGAKNDINTTTITKEEKRRGSKRRKSNADELHGMFTFTQYEIGVEPTRGRPKKYGNELEDTRKQGMPGGAKRPA